MFAVLIHIFYQDSWGKILREKLLPLAQYNPFLLINLCNINNNNTEVIQSIRSDFPEAKVIITPNKGKDIGGKLALLELFLEMRIKSDYIIFLHDKVSPHALKGDRWRQSLLKIIEPQFINKIIRYFSNNSSIGLVASKDFIKNEYDHKQKGFKTNNGNEIWYLLKKYNLTPDNYNFVAGTMFWIRTSIILQFFLQHSPLSCRKILEAGEVMDDNVGSYTHAWERVICWIGEDFIIKGI